MNDFTDRYATRRVLPPAEHMAELYAQGLSYDDIAALYGATRFGVYGAMKRAGIKVRGMRRTDARFWPKVNKDGPIPGYAPHLGPCWLWDGAEDGRGYGHFRGSDGATVKAYRVAYELAVGPVPDGMHLDHLCRVTPCVRPTHLEPVTQRVNILRGTSAAARNAVATHCIRGHEFTEQNTIINPRGGRNCRACRPIYWERQRKRSR